MTHLFILGLGYTAKRIVTSVRAKGGQVTATGTDGTIDFADEDAVRREIGGASHILSSIPPCDGGDPVLDRYGQFLSGKAIIYLSSTGVYGDARGAWVDETGPTGLGRRSARAQADARWLDLGARVLRLPGIYGPGRSALDRVRDGRAHRIDLPGQVFSRVHVDDIAAAAVLALEAPPGAYNIADDLPCSQNLVIEEACRLLGQETPDVQSIDEAGLSAMARGFYAENRRVANGKAKRVLGWQPVYGDYRSGLAAILHSGG